MYSGIRGACGSWGIGSSRGNSSCIVIVRRLPSAPSCRVAGACATDKALQHDGHIVFCVRRESGRPLQGSRVQDVYAWLLAQHAFIDVATDADELFANQLTSVPRSSGRASGDVRADERPGIAW